MADGFKRCSGLILGGEDSVVKTLLNPAQTAVGAEVQ